MEIPFVVFIFIYGAVVVVVAMLSFFNLYHAQRFGMHTAATYAMSFIYISLSVAIIAVTLITLRSTDWSRTFTIGTPLETIENPIQ